MVIVFTLYFDIRWIGHPFPNFLIEVLQNVSIRCWVIPEINIIEKCNHFSISTPKKEISQGKFDFFA